MTKFIKLTEVYINGNTVIIIINIENILAVKMSDKGIDTHIQMKDGKYFFVKETVDQIWERFSTDFSKPPIIMTATEALKFYAARDGV